MNKDRRFSVFVGFGILLICIIIVIMALVSAIKQNENANNIIYIDDGSGTSLGIPKSNVVTEYINTEKIIESNDYTLYVKVRLPKINIETKTIEKMNNDIYTNYQELYNYVTTISSNENMEIYYTYDYLDNDRFLEVLITKKRTVNGKEENTVIKYTYDISNDSYVVE